MLRHRNEWWKVRRQISIPALFLWAVKQERKVNEYSCVQLHCDLRDRLIASHKASISVDCCPLGTRIKSLAIVNIHLFCDFRVFRVSKHELLHVPREVHPVRGHLWDRNPHPLRLFRQVRWLRHAKEGLRWSSIQFEPQQLYEQIRPKPAWEANWPQHQVRKQVWSTHWRVLSK